MHHQFFSPFPSLTRRTRQTSDTSSPPSSRTASPPASPTTAVRPFSQAIPNHLFNLTFHPNNNPNPNTNPRSETSDSEFTSSSNSQTNPLTTSYHNDHSNIHPNAAATTPHPHSNCGVSVLPCAVLRGRSSMMVLRRRPSKIDLALSEERSRCNCDSIERQGLDLMEPRPVDMDMHAQRPVQPQPQAQAPLSRVSFGPYRNSLQHSQNQGQSPPRFVMGGIFEVMEGQA